MNDLLIARFDGDDEHDHRVAVFLQGGRFGGDRSAIVAPAPPALYVTPCNCPAREPCGSGTHWHDVAMLRELGDAPRHGAYYVKVDQRPARSGMEAVLYWYAGHEQPTPPQVVDAQNDFRRKMTAMQAAQSRANTTRKGQ